MSDRELSARQALIVDHPPRLAPLEPDQLSEEALGVLAGLIELNRTFATRSPEQLDELIAAHEAGTTAVGAEALERALTPVIRVMLRHPALFARHIELSTHLFARGTLPARERELVILRVGWLCRAPFEWGEHVHIGKGAGLSSEEVERITQGADAPGWDEHDRALLRAVEELLSQAFISDATWSALRYDDKQRIELILLVGQYQTVAFYQNSLRVPLSEGNLGLVTR